MRRVIRLTESDLTRIVRRVIKEDQDAVTGLGPQAKGAQYYAANKSKVDAAYNALSSLENDNWIDDSDISRVADILALNIYTEEAYVGLCYKFWNTGVDGTSYKTPIDYINKIRPCSQEKGGYGTTGGASQLWGSLKGNTSQNAKLVGSMELVGDLDLQMWKGLKATGSCSRYRTGGAFNSN